LIADGATTNTMSHQECEHGDNESGEWVELVDEIIDEDREVLDRLA
jgi:hypothetical protein